MKRKYLYTVGDEDHKFSLDSVFDVDKPDYIAEDAGEDYHSNHDGWEDDWPVDITLFKEDGTLIGKFTVELEHVPQFSASEIKRPKGE
jgi:hypothetical protein